MKLRPETLPEEPPRDGESGLPFADLVRRIAGEGARAWEVHERARVLQEEGRDVIRLTVGDPDFDTPHAISEACFAAIRQGHTHYVPAAGTASFLRAAARCETRLLARPIEPEQIVVAAGAQFALFCAMQCLAGPGDEVVLFDPAYATFEGVVRASGADVVHVSLARDQDFGFDPARLEAALTPRTRVVLANFPHNPTGRTLSAEAIEQLAAVLRGSKIWLLSDEVYYSLCFDGPFLSPAGHPELAARTVVLRSLSKSHAMSGWRIGWAVAPGDLPHHMQTLSNCMLYGAPEFVQDAAVFALETDLAEVAAMQQAYRERRDFVVARVGDIPRLSCVRPDAGIFCLIDVGETALSDSDFAWRLVEAEGVSVMPASAFGPSGAGYVRVSLTEPVPRLAEALDRLERFVRMLT